MNRVNHDIFVLADPAGVRCEASTASTAAPRWAGCLMSPSQVTARSDRALQATINFIVRRSLQMNSQCSLGRSRSKRLALKLRDRDCSLEPFSSLRGQGLLHLVLPRSVVEAQSFSP